MKTSTQLSDILLRNGVGASRVLCPAGAWTTVWAFLCERFAFIHADIWRERFENRSVLDAQGKALMLSAVYEAGAIIYYFRELAQEKKLPYEETILYQDECLVVADKPHFLPVIPSGQYIQETLLIRLKRRLNLPNLVPLHRIDRDTAGVVLFSVQTAQRGAYHNLFRDGLVHKQYQALAKHAADLVAKTSAQSWHIRNRLETANHFMQMHAVAGESNTHTELLAVTPLGDQPELARYTLRPHTGKRHQLRVHMMGLGVPILGDAIYPTMLPERDISMADHAPLQLLAQSVRFVDPFTGCERVFESQRSLDASAAFNHSIV